MFLAVPKGTADGGVAQLGVQVGQFIVNWRISLATHLSRIPENGRIGKNWGRSSAGSPMGPLSRPLGKLNSAGFGDVAQWESVRFASERSWVRPPSSPPKTGVPKGTPVFAISEHFSNLKGEKRANR